MGNYVSILLDETGSMTGQEHRVVTGVNEYVKKLHSDMKGEPCHIVLNLFDSERWQTFFEGELTDMPEFTEKDYVTGAATPLYDSVARAIQNMEAKTTEQDKVMIIIDTDGYENASQEFRRPEAIRAMVQRYEDRGWAFVFLASGLDAEKARSVGIQGHAMGMAVSNTVADSHSNRHATYGATAQASMNYFSGRVSNRAVYEDQADTEASTEET